MRFVIVSLISVIALTSGYVQAREDDSDDCKVTIRDKKNKNKKIKLKGMSEYKVPGANIIFFDGTRIEYQSNSRIVNRGSEVWLVANPNSSNSRDILQLDCRCGRSKGFWSESDSTVVCETTDCKRCKMNITLP